MERSDPLSFACDAMHGGLARWLRAAGYDATWRYGIGDGELLAAARAERRRVLTSDGGILARRVVKRGEVEVLFVPRGLSVDAQLAFVLRRLKLGLRAPRCMHCGGELLEVPREDVAAEAPPRTWLWVRRFFRCARCRELLWEGTHWQRIEPRLRAALEAAGG
jgi:uncharacterized protein with PIN domain